MDKNTTVGVVIITFNRLEFLKEVVAAVKAQTRRPEEIFVINNSSTDGTGEWLGEQDGLTVITQDNVGSSGGQYTGIKTAYDKDYDWIWTMDDDVAPDPECLERLLEGHDENTVRAPLRYGTGNKPYLNDSIQFNLSNPFKSIWKEILNEGHLKNEYIPAIGITFEGPIFHRSLVEKIGLPEKKFFIFGDDSEYFIRAAKAGAKILIYRDAILRRKLPNPDPVKQFDWKAWYSLRNIIAIDVLHGNLPVRVLRPIGYLLAWLKSAENFKNSKTVIKAFLNGYFYNSDNK